MADVVLICDITDKSFKFEVGNDNAKETLYIPQATRNKDIVSVVLDKDEIIHLIKKLVANL